jgi:hypothetical protein
LRYTQAAMASRLSQTVKLMIPSAPSGRSVVALS